MQYTTKDFEERKEVLEAHDYHMKEKLDFMYNYADFDHDRHRVRDKFLNEMNKRTSLADIGETLEQLHYESKAANWKHYKLDEHHNVEP